MGIARKQGWGGYPCPTVIMFVCFFCYCNFCHHYHQNYHHIQEASNGHAQSNAEPDILKIPNLIALGAKLQLQQSNGWWWASRRRLSGDPGAGAGGAGTSKWCYLHCKHAGGAISTASRQAGGAISTAASKASRHQLLTVQMHKPHSPMQPLPSPGLISNAVWKLGK